mmetsp:Transcript_8933/g.9910  ORF Transcript_8933/g.9910 Transcript_8933/m.9910 type:complete len:338 (+) Transcript_8933:134-1147(+)
MDSNEPIHLSVLPPEVLHEIFLWFKVREAIRLRESSTTICRAISNLPIVKDQLRTREAENLNPENTYDIECTTGIAMNSKGQLALVDYERCVISLVDIEKKKVIYRVGEWTKRNISDDGDFSTVGFCYPHGVLVNKKDDIILSDTYHHTLRVIKAGEHRVDTLIGVPNESGDKDGAEPKMYCPRGLSWDGNGNIVFCDSNNHRIRKVGKNAKQMSTILQNTAEKTLLHSPWSIAIDPVTDDVYTEKDGEIVAIKKGKLETIYGGHGETIYGLTFDSLGNLYFAGTSGIYKLYLKERICHDIVKLRIQPELSGVRSVVYINKALYVGKLEGGLYKVEL